MGLPMTSPARVLAQGGCLRGAGLCTRVQESKKNSLKDFVHVAGPLGVSHFL